MTSTLAGDTQDGFISIPVKSLMAIRDALILEDYEEAYHQLYWSVQWKDPYKPFAEWEEMLFRVHGLTSRCSLENLKNDTSVRS